MTEKCVLKYRPNSDTRKNVLYLASFSNGRIKSNNVNDIKFTGYQCSQTSDGLDRKKVRKILVADTGRLQYSGSNSGTSLSQRGEMCQHKIGVLNKRTGKMKLFDTDLIYCKPILITDVDTAAENATEKSFVEKMDSLTSMFGSKRKKRAMDSRHRYDVDGSDKTPSLENAVEQSNTEDMSSQSGSKDQTAHAIPPRNSNPTEESDVYNLYDIITQEEMSAIEETAKELKNASWEQIAIWKTDSTHAHYVLHHLDLKEGAMSLQKTKLLAYYNYMLSLFKLGYKEIRRRDPIPDIPEPFKSNLLEKFIQTATTESGRPTNSMPLRLKDKLIAYAMVLALFIEDFSLDLSLLQPDFKASLQRITKIAYALGCHISVRKINQASVKFAVLKLPLYTPKPFLKKARN